MVVPDPVRHTVGLANTLVCHALLRARVSMVLCSSRVVRRRREERDAALVDKQSRGEEDGCHDGSYR